MSKRLNGIIKLLNGGKVGVLPTDTLYGIVGRAFDKQAIKKIYSLRQRDKNKPLIILIGKISDLKKFKIELNKNQRAWLKKFWPGKISVILPCKTEKFKYLHRGAKTLAFRLPKSRFLLKLMRKTGPLAAPSANIQGQKPAQNIKQAKKYFGKGSDFYYGAGEIRSKPSTIVDMTAEKIRVVRRGTGKIYEK